MSSIEELAKLVVEFRDARDWKQFHHPKDLAVALSIEAAELLELFRFKSDEQIGRELATGQLSGVAHELADVLYFVLLMGHDLGVDLSAALREKLEISGQRYPVERSRGKNLKYTELT